MNSNTGLPAEAHAFAGRMYDAARDGQMDIFEAALRAGLPANMTNDKGNSLVSCHHCPFRKIIAILHDPGEFVGMQFLDMELGAV